MDKNLLTKVWIFMYLTIVTADPADNQTYKFLLEQNSPDVQHFVQNVWSHLDLMGEWKINIANYIKSDSHKPLRLEFNFLGNSVQKAQVEIFNDERRYIILVEYNVQVNKKIKFLRISKNVSVIYKCIIYVHTKEINPINYECFINNDHRDNPEQKRIELVYINYNHEIQQHDSF